MYSIPSCISSFTFNLQNLLIEIIFVCLRQKSLRCKETKNGGQALIVINWLFQDELLFQALATNLANIVVRKDDRYIALGWCILVRNLVEYESSVSQYAMNGKHTSHLLFPKCTICLR